MIVFNLAVLGWGISVEHSDPRFVALEVVAVILLLLEIAVRILHQRQRYLKRSRYWNCFDVVVGLSSALSVILLLGLPSSAEKVEDLLATAMRAMRYVAQALRVLLLVKSGHARVREDLDHISFTALDTDEEVGLAEELEGDDDEDDEGDELFVLPRHASGLGVLSTQRYSVHSDEVLVDREMQSSSYTTGADAAPPEDGDRHEGGITADDGVGTDAVLQEVPFHASPRLHAAPPAVMDPGGGGAP